MSQNNVRCYLLVSIIIRGAVDTIQSIDKMILQLMYLRYLCSCFNVQSKELEPLRGKHDDRTVTVSKRNQYLESILTFILIANPLR